MEHPDCIVGLSEAIERAIQDHLARSDREWPLVDSLSRPMLRIEAFIEDGCPGKTRKPFSEKIASRRVDLTGFVTPTQSRSPTATGRLPGDENSPVLDEEENAQPRSDEDSQFAESARIRDHSAMALDDDQDVVHRRGVGGLRILQAQSIEENVGESQRQMQTDNRSFPKRRKIVSESFVLQPSTLDKLIIGIWEQIHGTLNLDPGAIFEQFQVAPTDGFVCAQGTEDSSSVELLRGTTIGVDSSFSRVNSFCRKITQASRVCRSIEIIVQARWVELYEEQVQFRISANPQITASKHRKAAFMEACQDFEWTEKELRNKMAVWRGYKDVKDAAGWAALMFAGMGIYRFCKYRVGFTNEAIRRLRALRPRLEVAADTLHPNWRRILSIVGEPSRVKFTGHPHDWAIFEDGSEPVTIRSTYLHNDPYFAFEHIDDSIIDRDVWGCEDPRWTPQSNAVVRSSGRFTCFECGEQQSEDPKANSCYCFPKFFGCVTRGPTPVQVSRTSDGRNNGLVALTPFERGAAIGEFVGLVTKGLRHLDVMDGSTPQANYQIWQGRQGNYTRFVNHSCKANAQFQRFNWLDTQRIVLVSKGIDAGTEITVDYSDRYWSGLDKKCLCGESCCRYKRTEA